MFTRTVYSADPYFRFGHLIVYGLFRVDVKLGLSRQGKNRLLKKIAGTKRVEIIGGWRKLHNGELRRTFFPPTKYY
jgi:hypothetical protein